MRCLEDAELVSRLRAEQIPLTVCPLSNIRLCVFETMAQHTIKQMMDARLCVTVNSDDPPYFGGYVVENLSAVQQAFDLSRAEMIGLARNSFTASFLSDEEKQRFCRELDEFAVVEAL